MRLAAWNARGTGWIETTFQDLRFAWRAARKSPGFAIAAVSTLALVIGANTAIFSVANAIFLRPLPYAAPGRLAWVTEHNPRHNVSAVSWWPRHVSPAMFPPAGRPASIRSAPCGMSEHCSRVKTHCGSPN